MSPKLILGFLKQATTILFWLLILLTLFVMVTSVLEMSGRANPAGTFTTRIFNYEVMGFGLTKKETAPFSYSKDSLIGFREIKNHYALNIAPKSAAGYYALVSKLISLGFSICILWLFMKLFKQTKLDNPFTDKTVKRLKTLAVVFIISDLWRLANYLLFSKLLTNSFKEIRLHFELVTTVGNGFITGLIIWIIAIIFQRGINLQEENALTV